MGMSIDEAIKQLETYTIPCGKYKAAYDLAVETLRKYQQIREIVKEWREIGLEYDSCDAMMNIERVIEDGDNT